MIPDSPNGTFKWINGYHHACWWPGSLHCQFIILTYFYYVLVFNTLRPSDTCVRTGSLLVQVNACHLFWPFPKTDANLLSIGALGTDFSKIWITKYDFHTRKLIWKYSLQNGGHYVSASHKRPVGLYSFAWIRQIVTKGYCVDYIKILHIQTPATPWRWVNARKT